MEPACALFCRCVRPRAYIKYTRIRTEDTIRIDSDRGNFSCLDCTGPAACLPEWTRGSLSPCFGSELRNSPRWCKLTDERSHLLLCIAHEEATGQGEERENQVNAEVVTSFQPSATLGILAKKSTLVGHFRQQQTTTRPGLAAGARRSRCEQLDFGRQRVLRKDSGEAAQSVGVLPALRGGSACHCHRKR